MSRFDGPLSEWLYSQGEWEEEVGDSSKGVGWAGRYEFPVVDGGVIVFEKTDGSVHSAQYRTDAELFTAWAEVEEALGMDGPEPEEGDYVVQDSKGGYTVSQYGSVTEFTGVEGIDPVLHKIKDQMRWDKFFPNVWHVSDHGNYTLLDLAEMGIE